MLTTSVWVKILETKDNEGRLGLARGQQTARFSKDKEYLVLGVIQDAQHWLFLVANDFGIPTLLSYHLVCVTRTDAGPIYRDLAALAPTEEKKFEWTVAANNAISVAGTEVQVSEETPTPKKAASVKGKPAPDVAE